MWALLMPHGLWLYSKDYWLNTKLRTYGPYPRPRGNVGPFVLVLLMCCCPGYTWADSYTPQPMFYKHIWVSGIKPIMRGNRGFESAGLDCQTPDAYRQGVRRSKLPTYSFKIPSTRTAKTRIDTVQPLGFVLYI